MNDSDRQAISVKEARKLLGDDANKMSDEDIKMTVRDLEELASFLLTRYEADKLKKTDCNSKL